MRGGRCCRSVIGNCSVLQSDNVFTGMKADSEAQVFNSISCCFFLSVTSSAWTARSGERPCALSQCCHWHPFSAQPCPVHPEVFHPADFAPYFKSPPSPGAEDDFCLLQGAHLCSQGMTDPKYTLKHRCFMLPPPILPPRSFPAGLCLLRTVWQRASHSLLINNSRG